MLLWSSRVINQIFNIGVNYGLSLNRSISIISQLFASFYSDSVTSTMADCVIQYIDQQRCPT